MPIHVVVVDDHPIVRQGLRSLLSSYPDLEIVGEAGTFGEAADLVRREQPDVVLIDIRLPDANGIKLARRLRDDMPRTRTIILTSYDDDEYLSGAVEAGADGYLLKSASDDMLVSAIRSVHQGERLLSPELLDHVLEEFAASRRMLVQKELGLTDEEIRVLRLVADGASNDEIADALNWSKSSIKRKLQYIFEQLEVTGRAHAAAEAVRRGLI